MESNKLQVLSHIREWLVSGIRDQTEVPIPSETSKGLSGQSTATKLSFCNKTPKPALVYTPESSVAHTALGEAGTVVRETHSAWD